MCKLLQVPEQSGWILTNLQLTPTSPANNSCVDTGGMGGPAKSCEGPLSLSLSGSTDDGNCLNDALLTAMVTKEVALGHIAEFFRTLYLKLHKPSLSK